MAKKKKITTAVPVWFKHTWWSIPLLAILVYIPAFNAGFTLDDVPIIEENPYMRSLDKIPEIWKTHYWAGKIDANDKGLYRPLTLTTYNLQYNLTGKEAPPFHIVNILLHALVCFVLMKFLDKVFRDHRLTMIAGLLFAIHPIHTEAVAGLVGRAELLASLFILTGMISYHQYVFKGGMKWMILLLVSAFAAITSKEHGFLLGPVLVLQELYYVFSQKNYAWNKSSTWIGLGSVAALSIALWLYRSTITGPPVPHEQWLHVSSGDRIATALRTMAEYIGMHVWPLHLSADYWTTDTPIAGFGQPIVLMSLLFISGLLFLSLFLRNKLPVFSWGILFFFLMLLPVSNLVFAAGFLKAERVLYIPSIGLITVLSALLVKWSDWKNGKILMYGVLGAFSLFFIWRTWTRSGDWQNNYTLALATLQTSPASPRFNNMMGLELKAMKRNKEAMAYFEKSVQSNPNHGPALVNLGLEYSHANRNPEAVELLEKAVRLDPGNAMAYVNLMAVYREMGNYDKNLEVAEKAMVRFPEYAPVLWNVANAYHLKGIMDKANEIRAKAVALDPSLAAKK
jgi:tetratricopeptide (TPR) repeat protein